MSHILSFKPKTKNKETALIDTIKANENQLYRIAYSYLKNEADALDAVSEAILKAFENLDQLKSEGYMKTWLIRILINVAIDMQRHSLRHVEITENVVNQSTEEPHDNAIELDLEQGLANLREDQRMLINLRFFEDLSLNEIAEILDEPLSTVKSKLYRTLKALRLSLSEEV